MNETRRVTSVKMGVMFGAVLLGVMTGSVGCADRSRQARGYAPPPPDYYVENVVVQDDYVYYPGYQVYYSNYRRQYVYLDGRSWVARPAPPRVPVNVLVASPSVRLDFHNSPSIHHAAVVRQYPKNWMPPGSGPNHGEGNRDDGKGNDR